MGWGRNSFEYETLISVGHRASYTYKFKAYCCCMGAINTKEGIITIADSICLGRDIFSCRTPVQKLVSVWKVSRVREVQDLGDESDQICVVCLVCAHHSDLCDNSDPRGKFDLCDNSDLCVNSGLCGMP